MLSSFHELGCIGKLGLALCLCCAMLLMPGCGGGPSTTPPPGVTLTAITVAPLNQSAPVGGTLQFTATGHYSDGSTQDITTGVTWTSSDTTIATISNASGSNGLATGVARGSATIQATQGTPFGKATFNITEPLTMITISPANASVANGIPQQFTALGTYADNSTGDVTSLATWSSTSTSVATISNVSAFNGLASTLSAGSTTIQATLEGIPGSTSFTVNAAVPVGLIVSPQYPVISDAVGTTLQMKALAQYSDGTTQDVTSSVAWSSNKTGVATANGVGLVTSVALASGQTAAFTSIQAVYAVPPAAVKKSKGVKPASSSSATSTTGVSILGVTLHTGNGYAGTLTQHNDIARTGQNINESTLNTTNVASATFGKLFTQPVDGQLFAQPLYVPNVSIAGGTHNVIYLATENDSVYAYDADSNTGAFANPYWKVSLIDTAHGAAAGATAVGASGATTVDVSCGNISKQIGITATPTIDPSTNTMYVATESKENGAFFQRLHAIDITTGAEKSPASPVVITATVPGTGDGSTTVTFDPLMHLSRPGLLLLNGSVYIAYSSNCDNTPYHGWVFSYNAATFAQTGVYVTTPNGNPTTGGLGGIWMSGCGIAGDSNGAIYLVSGNGDFDTVSVPAINTGDSILKFALRGKPGLGSGALSLVDYFTPSDQDSIDSADLDLGSGGLSLLPDAAGSTAHPHMLVQAGKNGNIYLVDRDQLTANNLHYCSTCPSDTNVVQELPTAVGGMWSMPAYWNGNVYFWGSGDSLTAFSLSNGVLNTSPKSATLTLTPGSVPTVSANGTSNGIVWAIDGTSYYAGPGSNQSVLHAFAATNSTNTITELYNSKMATGNRDQAGPAIKFSVPTVANGKVYVGTQTELDVYGLLP